VRMLLICNSPKKVMLSSKKSNSCDVVEHDAPVEATL